MDAIEKARKKHYDDVEGGGYYRQLIFPLDAFQKEWNRNMAIYQGPCETRENWERARQWLCETVKDWKEHNKFFKCYQ